MEDKLISYETAKLAKEKGFWLTGADGMISSTFYRGEIESKPGVGWLIRSMLPNDCEFDSVDCYAPTQSLLQTWLRGRKIDVFVVPTFDGFEYEPFHANKEIDVVSDETEIIEFTCFINDGTSPPDGNWDVRIDGDIWEQVLEIGLFEGLKLIK